VSVRPCSLHGKKIDGKLASLYSAWFRADGERTAWKQLLCAPCVKEVIAPMLAAVSDESQDATACPACGSDSSSDLDPIYLNLYLPKQDAKEFALTTCSSCAAKLRISLQQGATKLPNRDGQSHDNSSGDDETDWGI
jgi:DNA-directed RNA polymerase subunit RPC12/RpoP